MYIAKCILRHNGKEYKAGQEVEVTDKEAQALLKDHTIVLVGDTNQAGANKLQNANLEIKALKATVEALQDKLKAFSDKTAADTDKTAADKSVKQPKEK